MRPLGELARKLAFHPESLPGGLVAGIALLPPVGAGLAVFGRSAAIDLGLAVGAGLVVQLAFMLARRRLAASPIAVAVTGVALIGPGAPPWWAAAVAGCACVLEIARSLAPGRPLPLHGGLWAYAAVYLGSRGAIGSYLAPGRGTRPQLEPIRLWHEYFTASAAPLDPVNLYVGNVAGPVFATSLLAVAIGASWLWYAKRIELLPLAGVAAGGVAVALVEGWNPAFHVLSGPLWFGAAYALADRRLQAGPPILGGLLGLAAGIAGLGLQGRGFGIEAALVALAATQLVLVVGLALTRLVQAGAPQAAVRRSIRLVRSPAGGQLK
jgi:hypothetical protein